MAAPKKTSLHEGHRERLRNKIKRYGLEALEEHEQLEYVLYAFIPRKDTHPIAHALIDTFGSLRSVLDASPKDLAAVKGMTENAALFLSQIPALYTSYLNSDKQKEVKNIRDAAERFMARIGAKNREHLLVMCLDERGYHIKTVEFTSDKRNVVKLDRDKIVAACVHCDAKIVLLAHNHPGGSLTPSEDDINATNRIAQALQMVGIRLADHIIVSDREYYSLAAHGCMVEPVDMDRSFEQFAEDLIRWRRQIADLRD